MQFSHLTSSSSSSLVDCRQYCFGLGFQQSALNDHCFCGGTVPQDISSGFLEGCSCQTDHVQSLWTGADLCSKVYISGAISSLPTVTLAPLRVFSTLENAVLQAELDYRAESYCWEFGDGSVQCNADGSSVSHNFAMAGSYKVTLTVSKGAGRHVVSFPVTAESELRMNLEIKEDYADVEKELPLHVQILSGSNAMLLWRRWGSTGVVNGKLGLCL